jgi:hypothetical protein
MKIQMILVAAALAFAALTTGCSGAATTATPVKAGCANDGECASLGPCGRCVSGTCQNQFGPACCGADHDCPADKPRCRNHSCN